jgi:DNA ligase 1
MSNKIIEILEALEATTKRTIKENILFENKDNELLKKVFIAALDPYTTYGIVKFKKAKNVVSVNDPDRMIKYFLDDILPQLSSRGMTGNAAKTLIERFFDSVDVPMRKWCERVLIHNLRCGVQASTVNKVWKDCVISFECQLATVLDAHCEGEIIQINENIDFPVQCEPKLDGLRLIAIKHNNVVQLFTRNGTELDTFPTLSRYLESRSDIQEMVFDAEGMAVDWNESASVLMSRKRAKDDKNMLYNVFDCMTFEEWTNQKCSKTQSQRREFLMSFFSNESNESPVKPTTVRICNNNDELKEFYVECVNVGYEGIMIKKLDGLYTFDRSKAWKKMKPIATYEGVIVGTYNGNPGAKREGLFGGFIVMLSNGVTTDVGSGMSDAMKEEVEQNRNKYIGLICENSAQPPLTADGKMRFPRFERFRDASDVDPKILETYESWKELKVDLSNHKNML